MKNELKNLLENDVLSDEVKASLVEAWNQKIQALREDISAEIRNEFATKYEKDKNELVEAMSVMIQTELTNVITEVNAEKKAAVEEQVHYKKAVRENIKSFDNFCQKVLEEEVSEFRQDRKAVAENFSKINDFVTGQVKTVLEDFHKEKRKLAEERVEFKINSKKELAETKAKLVKEQAKAASEFVQKVVTEELTQLKDELKEAKENNLGRKIFEAFCNEYSSTFFSEKKEVKKLVDAIKEREAKLEEARKQIEASKTKLVESQNAIKTTNEKLERAKVMSEILSPLSGEKREIMNEMLEKHQTSNLRSQFEKYLPVVLEESNPSKSRMLAETQLKEMSGNRKNIISESVKEEDKKVVSEFLEKFQKMNAIK